MIFIADGTGRVVNSKPETVYQGSSGSSTIYLIAPFPDCACEAYFTLPNGVALSNATVMTSTDLSTVMDVDSGETMRGWSCAIPSAVTAYYGVATVQFKWYTTNGKTKASGTTTFRIARGVTTLAQEADDDWYAQVLSALASIQAQVDNFRIYTTSTQTTADTASVSISTLYVTTAGESISTSAIQVGDYIVGYNGGITYLYRITALDDEDDPTTAYVTYVMRLQGAQGYSIFYLDEELTPDSTTLTIANVLKSSDTLLKLGDLVISSNRIIAKITQNTVSSSTTATIEPISEISKSAYIGYLSKIGAPTLQDNTAYTRSTFGWAGNAPYWGNNEVIIVWTDPSSTSKIYICTGYTINTTDGEEDGGYNEDIPVVITSYHDTTGKTGATGDTGTGVKTAVIDDDGCLVITLTDGTEINVGLVVGTNGATYEATTEEYEGELYLAFVDNERTTEVVQYTAQAASADVAKKANSAAKANEADVAFYATQAASADTATSATSATLASTAEIAGTANGLANALTFGGSEFDGTEAKTVTVTGGKNLTISSDYITDITDSVIATTYNSDTGYYCYTHNIAVSFEVSSTNTGKIYFLLPEYSNVVGATGCTDVTKLIALLQSSGYVSSDTALMATGWLTNTSNGIKIPYGVGGTPLLSSSGYSYYLYVFYSTLTLE